MLRLADYRDSEPPHAELALVLAAELHPVDTDNVERRLDGLAVNGDALSESAEPPGELEALGALVVDRFPPPPGRPHDDSDLLLDGALANGHAQPVIAAVIATEIGRRCGVPLGIVSDGRRHFVAHRDAAGGPLLDPVDAHRPRHPAELRCNLSWHCAHQVCCAVLQTLLDRALRHGDLGWAIHLAELKLALPFDDQTHQLALSDLGSLRAQLN